MDALVWQIETAIQDRVVSSLRSLGWSDLALEAEGRVAATAAMLVTQLLQDEDDRLSAQTVIDCAGVLFDLVPEPEWWRTPFGRLVARSIGRDDAESVSHSVAAAMLGVTRGTVAQLVHRGTLDRHPDGGVLRGSVLQRIGRS